MQFNFCREELVGVDCRRKVVDPENLMCIILTLAFNLAKVFGSWKLVVDNSRMNYTNDRGGGGVNLS